MQAIPQPSGWPAFGFGCGHPKFRKFRPVSASWRKAIRVSTGAGLRLTIPSMRHMSVQLVPDLPEEGAPFVPLLLPFDPLRAFAVHDSEDPPTARRFRDDHVDRVRRRGENGHGLRHLPDGPEDVDRIRVPEEDDEEVARADRH